MRFENTDVWGFKGALRGMRNPKNSWDRSDSVFEPVLHIGEADMKLATTLIRGGSEHRKFLRQIFVSVNITAPLYWWKEFDTYKVGTTANSTSTMHKLTSQPITLDCFETDDLTDMSLMIPFVGIDESLKSFTNVIIDGCEGLRKKCLETGDKRYWKELIRWLPESWLQTRTVTLTYENLLSIAKQRRNHKLNEWSGKDDASKPNMIAWMRTLPYAQEFIFYDEVTE